MMKTHQVLLLVALGALFLGAGAHSHHRRGLLQRPTPRQRRNSAGRNVDKANNGNRNRTDGKMFDFSRVGGAASFLAKMDEDKLQRLVERAGWTKGIGGLAKQLNEDPDFGIDLENEALLFACEGLLVGNSEIASGLSPSALDPNFSQAFNLTSRPASTKKIWLDFDGCVITNSAWNSATLPTITIPAYDTDNNPTTFSSFELSDIVAIWRAVSEDYAPFDVDVTTIPPGSGISPNFISRVCIGGNGAWYGQAGGVAYINVFGTSFNAQYSPAFVFPANLANYAKYVWEAVSHEVGHNMGLSHDGTQTLGYYDGQGEWAPIMGVGYYKNVTQWSKGEYTGANQLEDDTAILASKLSYVPPLNGNSLAAATPLATVVSGSIATGSATGIVTRPGVADFFSFNAPVAGTAAISGQVVADWGVNWLPQRSNLDMLITLFDSTGANIATINPPTSFTADGLGTAAVSVNLPTAGTYYVSVAGTGSGSAASTGYSSYGSLGQFGVTVVYPVVSTPSPSPLPTLNVAPATISGPTPAGARFTCTASITVRRAGTTTLVGSATVSITWSTLTSSPGFPYSTTVTTLANGVATIMSNRIASGRGCRYTVTAVAAAGYAPLSTSVARQISF